MMMVLGNKRSDEDDEEVGSGGLGYLGEEEYEEEEVDNGSEYDDGKKTQIDQTPLWKYITMLRGGKCGGTTKFIFPHCKSTYTGSYNHARKHLSGKRPWDGNKQIGIKTYANVPT